METRSFALYYQNGNTLMDGYNYTGNFSINNGYDTLGTQVVDNGNGYFIRYNYFNKTKSSEGKYANGNKKGLWIYYNSLGNKIEEYDYDKDIIINAWDNKGQKLIVENGNGNYIRYYQNGRVKLKGKYVDGKEEGTWTWYYENGDIERSGNYTKGLKEGVWSSYYDKNKLKEQCRYKKGDREGTYMTWHSNGRPSSLGYYENDYHRGKWVWFNEDGTVKSKTDYTDKYRY